jgi:hypothetical protein
MLIRLSPSESLQSLNPNHQQPLISTTARKTPYPIYANDSSTFDVAYVNARILPFGVIVWGHGHCTCSQWTGTFEKIWIS